MCIEKLGEERKYNVRKWSDLFYLNIALVRIGN